MKRSLKLGFILAGLGVFSTVNSFMFFGKGVGAKQLIDTSFLGYNLNFLLYIISPIIAIFGAIIIGAFAKGWLERESGTRWD